MPAALHGSPSRSLPRHAPHRPSPSRQPAPPVPPPSAPQTNSATATPPQKPLSPAIPFASPITNALPFQKNYHALPLAPNPESPATIPPAWLPSRLVLPDILFPPGS